MSTSAYQRVRIRSWAGRSCAGDAAASLAACRAGRPALAEEPGLGWCGRIADLPPGPERLMQLAGDCAAEVWRAQDGRDPALPFLSCAASKGDSPALLDPHGSAAARLRAAQPGDFPIALARRLGLRGAFQASVPVAACSTGLYALLAAADALECGRSSVALTGAADASLQPLLLAGFRQMGVLCRQQPAVAGGAGGGFAPGEGAGFFLLAEDGPWRLLGGVRLGDACHPTHCADPAVLRRCLEELWRLLPEPELIVVHGTGTAAGDAYERAGLESGPWRGAPRLLCKPIIGHCLGASGVVELAIALAGEAGRIWKLGLGFGGHVAGVALQRETR